MNQTDEHMTVLGLDVEATRGMLAAYGDPDHVFGPWWRRRSMLARSDTETMAILAHAAEVRCVSLMDLVEATLDGMTGEFDRLRDIGFTVERTGSGFVLEFDGRREIAQCRGEDIDRAILDLLAAEE